MGFTEPEVILAMAETIMLADQERDEALAEVKRLRTERDQLWADLLTGARAADDRRAEENRLRELHKMYFDLYHEAMEKWRAAAAERDELRVRLELEVNLP